MNHNQQMENLAKNSPEVYALLSKTLNTKKNIINNIKIKTPASIIPTTLSIPAAELPPGNYVSVFLRNGLANRIFQILAALGYSEKYKKKVILCKSLSREGPKPHEIGLFNVISKIFPNIPMLDGPLFTTIHEKKEMNYTPLENLKPNVLLYGYFQDERYFPSKTLIPTIRTTYYLNTYFVHIRAGDYLGSFGLDLVEYHKKCFTELGNVIYLVFSDDNNYADAYMKQFGIKYTICEKVEALESLVEMANCAGGICANSTFSWLGGFFQGARRGKIFMPSVWLKGRDCSGIYPTWATVVDIGNVQAAPILQVTPIPRAPATQAPATQAPATQAPATQAPATQAPATQTATRQEPATQTATRQEPATQAASILPQINNSKSLVSVTLGNCGLGNKIFKIFAGLTYAEKYNKEFVIDRSKNIASSVTLHTQNLDTLLIKLFPKIRWVDSIQSSNTIHEKIIFIYSDLPNQQGNVILDGYFQNEQYFPSPSLIPDIRTGYYSNTYFVHIRVGDYLETPDGWGYDKTQYYKNCFTILGNEVTYLVFSNDNAYADKYMKQFNVQYTISDKVNPLETLVEMANCAGGICANSSFSWLGGFFQGDTRGKIYMPSVWAKNKPKYTGFYPTWVNIVSIDSIANPLIKYGLMKYQDIKYSLVEWQNTIKNPNTLIIQASSVCGGDLWMPFPIGMQWQYVKFFNTSQVSKWQIDNHTNLVLCAVTSITDSRRRPSGINRQAILNTLQKNGIQNIKLQGEQYFSSLPSYKFVISPEGNGIDCHRHYEALLAGCIPIMEYNDLIQEKYKGLPILYTKDYSEITPQYLEQKYSEIANAIYDFSRLFLSYYSIEQQEEIKKCGTYWIKRICGQSIEWYTLTPNIEWITLINAGYIDFTRNFIESMKRNNCMFPLTVYCTDNESMISLQEYSNVRCIDAKLFLKFEVSESLTSWGQIDYKKLVFAKLDAIKYAMTQYPKSYIGYIDTDIILFKNPTNTILKTFQSNSDAIFVSQCDEPKTQCSNSDNCQHFCSGVIVFKNVDIVNKLLDYTPNDVMTLSGDQHYLLNMANKYNIRHITVDKNIFLNGTYPGVNNLNIPLIVPPLADLIHYNYLVGNNKIKLMQKNNMWFI